jgi:hypothetical protein
MKTGKTSKYLKYAIGEIVLVVIGILIALQINNWNEQRKNNIYELKLLEQLKKDLVLNSNDLKGNLSLQQKGITSAQLLLNGFKDNLPYHDSLLVHFANTGIWTKFIVNEGAYKTIESKGLDIISNLELRELVFEVFEGNLYWLKESEKSIINEVEYLRIEKAATYFKKWNTLLVKNNTLVDGTAELLDYNSIANDNDFIYYLNSYKNMNEIVSHITRNNLKSNQKAIEIIEDILNKSN